MTAREVYIDGVDIDFDKKNLEDVIAPRLEPADYSNVITTIF
jgi:hypothetical protein